MLLPASILRRIYEPFLRKIPAAEAWGATLRAAAARGSVIHVVRNVSLLDLLALQHLSERFGLPEIAFANDFEEVLSSPPARGLFGRREEPAARLRRAVESGKSAVLFLKRAPGVIERASTTHRGKTEGDALLEALVDIVRTGPREVLLVPETLVWTLRPERLGFSLRDFLFSPAEFPGEVRALAQLGANHEHVVVRAGDPLVLRELLATEGDAPHLVRRLVYALLRKVERERKSVVGPAQKPPDRVREEVLKSPRLGAVLRDMSRGDEAAHRAAVEKARGMLRGLSAEPDPSTLRVLETLADTVAERVFSGIDVDEEGIERVREAARRGSVVLLPSHKSHVDYLLLHYVLRKHALSVPLVAAGDNLSFFPLGPLLRRSGAFFIRRSFRGDKLYTVVVDAYIRRLLRDGYGIELFIEGGRSRTGKLLPPQVGLLNMVAESAFGLEGRPISFVPVSIGYERMMEETEFLRELSGEAKKGEDLSSLVSAGRALLGSYGRPNVQFGKIVDFEELRTTLRIPADPTPAKRRSLVSTLAQTVMDEINRVTAVTPGALVATVLLCHPRRGMPHAELLLRARRLLTLVRSMGARVTPKLVEAGGGLSEAAIREAADVYVRGGLLRRHVPGDTLTGVREKHPVAGSGEAIWIVPEERRIALDIPKNMIVHLFVDRAIVAVALGASDSAPPLHDRSPAATLERARFLARLFRFELNLRADATFDARFSATQGAMERAGELARAQDGALVPGEGHDGLDGRGWLLFYAAVLRNFLEGYAIAARALRTLTGAPAEKKELVARALRIGEQMFLGGEVERAEAVSRSLVENAVAAFRDLGYLQREAEALALADPHRSEAGAAAIEAQIAAFLARPAYDTGF
jgi:glycerol-3-phosphate O-acyltransferase